MVFLSWSLICPGLTNQVGCCRGRLLASRAGSRLCRHRCPLFSKHLQAGGSSLSYESDSKLLRAGTLCHTLQLVKEKTVVLQSALIESKKGNSFGQSSSKLWHEHIQVTEVVVKSLIT